MARTVIIAHLAVLTAERATPAQQQRQRQAICLLPAELAVAMAALAMAALAVRFAVQFAVRLLATRASLDTTVIRAAHC